MLVQGIDLTCLRYLFECFVVARLLSCLLLRARYPAFDPRITVMVLVATSPHSTIIAGFIV
jgi:hypothetical protein